MDEIPARDYDLLMRYWRCEPWGPWRDNLHAAMIALEVQRPYLKKGARASLDAFMIRDPEERQRELDQQRKAATANLYQLFKSIAVKKRKPS